MFEIRSMEGDAKSGTEDEGTRKAVLNGDNGVM